MKPFTCKHCNKCFSHSSNCNRHERIHTEVKPYACKHCNKCFGSLSACKRHKQTHTGGIKPYPCKYCNKGFSQSSDYKRHERTHTEVKHYTCKHCKKCFSQSSSCKRHELYRCNLIQEQRTTHTDATYKSRTLPVLTEETLSEVESLTCWICQEEFSSKARLVQHYDDHMRNITLK